MTKTDPSEIEMLREILDDHGIDYPDDASIETLKMLCDDIPLEKLDNAPDDNDFSEKVTVNCPICQAELIKLKGLDEVHCPTCDMWLDV